MTKSAAVAGALVAALWGGAALAEECPAGTQRVVINESSSTPVADGSATTSTERVECRPMEAPGIGGSGTSTTVTTTDTPSDAPVAADNGQTSVTVESRTASQAPVYVPVPTPVPVSERPRAENDMRGLTLLVGGGVEAYAGALSNQVAPGAAWGVTAAIKPTRILGVELGYTGAANNVRGVGTGADIIRNGGVAALTLGFTAAPIQPYALAGVGIDAYNVRQGLGGGFRNDVSGQAPIGGGVRGHFGHFTADLRGAYGFTFDQDFASGVPSGEVAGLRATNSNAGRYYATLNLGGTF